MTAGPFKVNRFFSIVVIYSPLDLKETSMIKEV